MTAHVFARSCTKRRAAGVVVCSLGLGLLGLESALLGCSEPRPGPNVGSNSNWMRSCTSSEECGSPLTCQCGACTGRCQGDADCEGFGDARCVLEGDPSASAYCRDPDSLSSGGMCRPRCQAGTCASGQACVLLGCTPLDVPSSGECATVATQASEGTVEEDELVDIVERARQEGSIVCAGGEGSSASNVVRVDERLYCAARLFAADLAMNHRLSLVDSQGRGTSERMALAGYASSFWVEGYADGVQSASEAWSTMLRDGDFCSAAGGARVRDVGVGVIGGAYVVTLGAE